MSALTDASTYLPEAIDSLLAQDYPKKLLEIMVIDNSGQPSMSSDIQKKYKRKSGVRYIIEEKPGLSRARNIGWRSTDADIIAYIDDDAVAASNWVTELVKSYQHFGDEASVVGGKVDPIWPLMRPHWIHDYMVGFLSIVDWGGETRITTDREWLAGTNVSFRRILLERFGGFDEDLGRTELALLSNEEIALIAKIKKDGGKTIYNPEALVQHMISPKRLTHDWFRQRAFWQALSDLLMQSESDLIPEHVWDGITKYFRKLPPAQRTPAGFFADPDDPELFQEQLNALYNMVRMFGHGLPCPATHLVQ